MHLPITRLPIDRLFFIIEFLGVFVAALGGALAAIRDTRYKYDLVGVIGLSMASALGGGITRDVILQHGPPLAFVDVRYLITAMGGAITALTFAGRIGRSIKPYIRFAMRTMGSLRSPFSGTSRFSSEV